MELGRRSFPFSTFNHARQKQQLMQQQQQQNVSRHPRWIQAMSPPINGGSAESRIANLQQCISAYLDSIQMVCRAGSWLSETLAFLLRESSTGAIAEDMKSRFAGMLQLSLSTTVEAKNELAQILMELSLPNLNNNNQVQAIKDCKTHNAKVLEKCIRCLSVVHNTFFKVQLDTESVRLQDEMAPVADNNDNTKDTKTPQDPNNNKSAPSIEKPSIDFSSEWTKLSDANANAKSWFALKERTSTLRKYNGLTETEIQNLLTSESVSDLYLKKLNQKIDTALRNYEVGLRGLPSESVVVFGGFHSSPDQAKLALKCCCSQMEMEQDIQRLPVSQFLYCELPLMTLTVNKKDFPSASSSNSSSNINHKKNAVSQLIQSTNQKLSISETDELSSEILGEICPARWRTHVKACLQLLYGNSGLVIMDTISRESRNKQSALICQKDCFIVVSVSSTWCVKEDPGTMSLLQRNLDPEKNMATINVRYISVFNSKSDAGKRFEPGIFVEAFVQTGSQNRRRASQTLRASQSLFGVPLTPMSACWLPGQATPQGSPVLLSRLMSATEVETKPESTGGSLGSSLKKSSSVKSEGGDSGSGSERKRKKKIVVEIKSDTGSEEEKSSDNEDSVRDVIHLLSGSSRRATRRRFQIEREAKEAETDEMSVVIEKILDSDIPCPAEKETEANPPTDEKIDTDRTDEPKKNSTTQQQSSSNEASTASSNVSNVQRNPEMPVRNTMAKSSSPRTFIQPSPLSQSQTNLTQSQTGLAVAPFHQKSKSQTLPVSYAGISQTMQMHEYSKSMSNTLPQLRGRNLSQQPQPNPASHPYPALPSKQTISMPLQQQLQCGPSLMQHGPQDPRHFIHRHFSPPQMQSFSQIPPNPGPSPQVQGRPNVNRSPNLQPRQAFSQPQNQVLRSQHAQQYTMNENRYGPNMMGPNNNLPQNIRQDPEPQISRPPNIGQSIPQYVPSENEDRMQMVNQPGNVQALLQHFNKLAKQQEISREDQRYNENFTIQQFLMLGPNQQVNENACQMQQNSNNNNLPTPTPRHATHDMHHHSLVSNSSRWDLGGSQQRVDPNNNSGEMLNQANIPPQARLMSPGLNSGNGSIDNSAMSYNHDLMQAAFERQMRLRVKEDVRSKSPDEMDQFVSPSQHGNLGPIGSPVITRRRTNEMSPPMHLAVQNQGSNTWPSVHDLPNQARHLTEGDPEYEQYVAGIAKNTVQRKLMSQRSIDELEASGKSNTWEIQSNYSWQRHQDSREPLRNPFSVFDTPDLAQHIRGCDPAFSEEDIKQTEIMEGNLDPARTGTWPPWELWSSGSGNLWNWSNDLLNTSSCVENPNSGPNAKN